MTTHNCTGQDDCGGCAVPGTKKRDRNRAESAALVAAFLDEIGALPYHANSGAQQALEMHRLLRVLQVESNPWAKHANRVGVADVLAAADPVKHPGFRKGVKYATAVGW